MKNQMMSFNTKKDLKWYLNWQACNWSFRPTNYACPSIANNIHIVGSMSKIILAFDHLLAHLTLVGLKVKV
jgi:hypothetical protein